MSRQWIVSFTMAAGVVLAVSADSPQPGSLGRDLNALKLRVDALRELSALELTRAQLEELLKLAEGCADPKPRDPVVVNESVRKALEALHHAFVADDADAIGKWEDQLADVVERTEAEFNDAVNLTETSRRRAAAAQKVLGLPQIVAYVAVQGDSLADPRQALDDALTQGAEMNDKDWNDCRDDTADAIADVLAGTDAARHASARASAARLLDRWRKEAPSPKELDAAAKELTGELTPFDMIQNALRIHLARLLANPQAVPALRARLAGPQGNNKA